MSKVAALAFACAAVLLAAGARVRDGLGAALHESVGWEKGQKVEAKTSDGEWKPAEILDPVRALVIAEGGGLFTATELREPGAAGFAVGDKIIFRTQDDAEWREGEMVDPATNTVLTTTDNIVKAEEVAPTPGLEKLLFKDFRQGDKVQFRRTRLADCEEGEVVSPDSNWVWQSGEGAGDEGSMVLAVYICQRQMAAEAGTAAGVRWHSQSHQNVRWH